MNLSEFSNTFDVLWNNITSNQAPGLSEYEKSVFLTKGQSQLVNEYFNNRTDGFGGGFDGSQKRQYDFSGLVRVEELYNVNTFRERIDSTEKLDKRSKVFLFPENYFLAVNEILSDGRWQYSVIPLSYAEYQRVMTKPYNFPIKRGAWRIFTDKKNCNVWEGTITSEGKLYNKVNYPDGLDGKTISPVTYSFTSSWADRKRNLEIRIVTRDNDEINDYGIFKYNYSTGAATREVTIGDEEDFYAEDNKILYVKDNNMYYIYTDCAWSEDKLTYIIFLRVADASNNLDDENVIEILKNGFTMYNNQKKYRNSEWEVEKAAAHTDGFLQAEAPSKFVNLGGVWSYDGTKYVQEEGAGDQDVYTLNDSLRGKGLVFTTSVKPLPMAEIIGKFYGDVKYQLRYIRTLTPIILEDLTNYGDDITIDGITAATECALPVETHQEILERAVTLAKIAWQGGTMTQAQAQAQRD